MASVTYLPMNEPVTITLGFARFWDTLSVLTLRHTSSKIKDILVKEISTGAKILSVEQYLGSDRFVIMFEPRSRRTQADWEQTFISALEKHNYEPNVVAFDIGMKSSAPGGMIEGAKGVLTEVIEIPAIKETTTIIKLVAVGAIALAAIVYLPMLSGIGSSVKKGLGGRR